MEKQKIIKDSAGKLLNQSNDGNMKSEALSTIRKKTVANSIRPALHSSKDSSKCNSSTLEMQSNSASIVNDNDSISAKKHSSRAANFFDRYVAVLDYY